MGYAGTQMSASDSQDTTQIPAFISHGANLCHTVCMFAGQAGVQMDTGCSLFPCLLHSMLTTFHAYYMQGPQHLDQMHARWHPCCLYAQASKL